jgi:2-C-methyl-D-erythritol 4-phosphate cytidylyltransferase/2-C-methyl-D-erythritol 2,4-cyclodiphosphate synthase
LATPENGRGTAVIVAAAGSGRRMGRDKMLLPLDGRPVLARTLDAVDASGVADQVVVAVRPGLEAAVRALDPGVEVVTGGPERSETVRLALGAVGAHIRVVLIHDGARPLVSPRLLARVAAAVEPGAAAIAALPVADTLHRASEGRVAVSLDRSGLWAAQTPQGFDRCALAAAMAWGSGRPWTDEAALFAAWGGTVRLIEGEATNLKLTRPEDVALAEAFIRGAGRRERRVGHGWDVHRLAPARRLVLGGVELQRRDGLGLLGHSDADALAHAVADALLGAAARGDIGSHFPPDDPRFAGADSLDLLARVARLVGADGWAVANVDATVIADEPRLAPHVALMRSRLAGALGVAEERVSVKAATSEGLEPSSVSAHAVALLERAL